MAGMFTLNEELWERGRFYNCGYSIKLGFYTGGSPDKKLYFSGSLDSLEAGTLWHRAIITSKFPEDAVMVFLYFAQDSRNLSLDGETADMDEVIRSDAYRPEDKKALFERLSQGCAVNPEDVLLPGAKGRYFWFCLEINAGTGKEAYLERLSIEFSVPPLTEQLPGCFREREDGTEFLDRFLSIFQTVILEQQEKINHISNYINPELTSVQFLPWLADWIGSPELSDWPEQKQREWIRRSFSLSQKKGTRRGLVEFLELFTGKKPGLIETFQIMGFYPPAVYEERYRLLYGCSPYTFLVFYQEEDLTEKDEAEQIRELILYYQPAHAQGELVVLKPYIILGQHCYLGINSAVAAASAFRLDNTTVLPFQTVLTGPGDDEPWSGRDKGNDE